MKMLPVYDQGEVFEIINPSDAYTIEGDFEACCAAVLFLGNGRYGMQNQDGSKETPAFFLFGATEKALDDLWIKEFGHGLEAFCKEKKSEIGAAMRSVLIGNYADRQIVNMALAGMPDESTRKAWLAARHDPKCSSLNDIGSRAAKYGASMQEEK